VLLALTFYSTRFQKVNSYPVIFPIIIIFTGALAAALCGLPALNRRLTAPRLGWILSVVPLSAFVLLLQTVPDLQAGTVFTWQIQWLPSIGINASLYFDSLAALFALLITFIGTVVIIYAGQYFRDDSGTWRFFTYLLLFMGAMLGLVMAGDVITLFIFWEGTSIVSFLLVAYKYKDDEARRGAFKALFITAGGGIALLIGLLFMAHVVGDSRFIAILSCGDALRESGFYPLILGLIALGAFTKSAQFPFHIWLPDAMSAPAPASAYLHSATMVKAGIYLLARLHPVMGLTETWFWLLTLAGMATMLTGAVLGIKKNDLKAVLAYSTICQLGILVMMIGQDMQISFKALIIGILAHALYKSTLFLVVGIVDHETGTRDLRRLGGLRRSMPFTFAIGGLAALSMAGLPPLFGFLAKETLLATAVHRSLPTVVAWIFTLASVLTGALMLVISGRLIWDTFLGQPRDPDIHGHEAPAAMLMAPAIPAILSLVLGQVPGPKEEAALLANAAGAAYGAKVEVSLALWTGLNVPLFLSMIAISIGTLIFIYRRRITAWMQGLSSLPTLNALFTGLIQGIDILAAGATRFQHGKLRFYLVTMLASALVLVFFFGGFPPPVDLSAITAPIFSYAGELVVLKIVALLIVAGTSLACVLLANDFFAILAFGASGLGVAVLLALEPAPDVALVQIVVDVLLIIILVLALSLLPGKKLREAQKLVLSRQKLGIWRDALVSIVFGIVVMYMSLAALLSRSRISELTPFFESNAKATGSKSIVGAILMDFRGIDTLNEIVVFSIAGLGIYTLLWFGSRKHKDIHAVDDEWGKAGTPDFETLGIGGNKLAPLIQVLARIVLPLAMAISVCELLYGHDQPGDGFTAGVITSIGIGFWYVVFGYHETRRHLFWIRPSRFISWGILLAILTGTAAMFVNGSFLSNVDFGMMMGLKLPAGIHLSTSFLFESAIALSVVGSVMHMLNAMGHPEEEDT
jgi:multicomponent K+:H+ antiporter subunit A